MDHSLIYRNVDVYSGVIEQAKKDSKFVFTLGGDHSLTSHAFKHYDCDIVQFDAHCDLRDSYDNNPQSHACAMRRCMDLNEDTELYSFGIRNMSKSEDEYIQQNKHRMKKQRITYNYTRNQKTPYVVC